MPRKASSRCQECLQTQRGEKRKENERVGQPTRCRERIVVSTQAQEKEERCEPDADPEEGRHVSEGGGVHHGPAAIRLTRHLACLVRNMCEIEEPHEMVDDDKDAGRDEGWGGKGDEWPCVGEILQVYNVAEYGERDLVRGEGICECQQDVYRDDDLNINISLACALSTFLGSRDKTNIDASLSDDLGDFGVLFDQFGKPE